MSVKYKGVGWNRQKKIYDAVLLSAVTVSLGVFAGMTPATHPNATIETLLIRGTAWTAILLLHVILCIGPLARLDARFLPLLYNRRHLGVTMFCLALAHAAIALVQFHALGRANPLASVFTAYRVDYNLGGPGGGLSQFPFEPFGAFALLVLFLMAATSHDFWLRNLGASVWKVLHMLVYAAYGALLVHVSLGFLQSERSAAYVALFAAGLAIVAVLHVLAYRKEAAVDRARAAASRDGFLYAYKAAAIADGRGKAVRVGEERIAIFRNGDRIHAMSNVCRHQGGPIGEGRIVDGCVTCPWHGWQYKPESGCSPPPFSEVIPTYPVRVIDGDILVRPTPNALGSESDGAGAGPADGAVDLGEFYIGYQKRAPAGLARLMRRIAAAMIAATFVLTLIVAAAQSPFGRGVYEFGVSRTFEGDLLENPVPMLRITGANGAAVALPIVGSGKFGLPKVARGAHGKRVRFVGSLIYRDGAAMIEMNDVASFSVLSGGESLAVRAIRAGHVTLVGELVDTKCYFGVMRPATGKVHRACAVRCLDGGVPPGLLLKTGDGADRVVLLAGEAGRAPAFDPQWAALTVVAEGDLEIHEGVPVLRTAALRPVTGERATTSGAQ